MATRSITIDIIDGPHGQYVNAHQNTDMTIMDVALIIAALTRCATQIDAIAFYSAMIKTMDRQFIDLSTQEN